MRFVVSMMITFLIFNYHVFGTENEFTFTELLDVKWKVTTQDGKKGEVKFNLKNGLLQVSLKGKETKGKWITKSTEQSTMSLISVDNHIRFEKRKLLDSSSIETNEENIYQTTDFMIFSKVNKNHFRMITGHEMGPLKLTQDNRWNVSRSSEIIEIKK
jgi:hypothetical protein